MRHDIRVDCRLFDVLAEKRFAHNLVEYVRNVGAGPSTCSSGQPEITTKFALPQIMDRFCRRFMAFAQIN